MIDKGEEGAGPARDVQGLDRVGQAADAGGDRAAQGRIEETSCQSGSEALGTWTPRAVAPPVLVTLMTMVKLEPKLRGLGETENEETRSAGDWIVVSARAEMVEPRPSKATAVWEKVTAPATAAL